MICCIKEVKVRTTLVLAWFDMALMAYHACFMIEDILVDIFSLYLMLASSMCVFISFRIFCSSVLVLSNTLQVHYHCHVYVRTSRVIGAYNDEYCSARGHQLFLMG